MSNHNKQGDGAIPADPVLSRAYRDAATDQPPASLDQQILGMAHDAVASTPERPRWMLPLSVAATVTIAVSLGIQVMDSPPPLDSDSVMRAPAQPKAAPGLSSEFDDRAEPLMGNERLRPAAPATQAAAEGLRRDRVAATLQEVFRAQEPAQTPAAENLDASPIQPDERANLAKTEMAPPAAVAMAPPPANVRAMSDQASVDLEQKKQSAADEYAARTRARRLSEDASRALMQDFDQAGSEAEMRGAFAQRAPGNDIRSAVDRALRERRSEEDWLIIIKDLHSDGNVDEAWVEWRAFQVVYPAAALPTDFPFRE